MAAVRDKKQSTRCCISSPSIFEKRLDTKSKMVNIRYRMKAVVLSRLQRDEMVGNVRSIEILNDDGIHVRS